MKKPKRELSESEIADKVKAGKAGGIARARNHTKEKLSEMARLGAIATNKKKAGRKAMSDGGKKSLVIMTDKERSDRGSKGAWARWKK